MTPQQPTQPDPAAQWGQFAAGIDPGVPDQAYDSMRQQFFDTQVLPHVVKQGYDPHDSEKEFMEKTKRKATTSTPRLDLIGHSALESMAAPFMGDQPKLQSAVQHGAEQAEIQAQREGINPAPYETVGSMLGQLPYWATGLGAAGSIAEGAGTALVNHAIKMGAGAMIQGSYDMMKDRSIISGLQGAAVGGALTGLAEVAPKAAMGAVIGGAAMGPVGAGIGATGGFMADAATGSLGEQLIKYGVSKEAASAVEAVAKGHGTEADWNQSVQAILQTPKLDEKIQDWVQQQVKAAKQVGVAQALIPDIGAMKRVKIAMTGADGKPYNLGGAVGVKLDDLQAVVGRINDHLNAGGSIDRISGDPRSITQFFNVLSMADPEKFDLGTSLRGSENGTTKVLLPNDAARPKMSMDLHELINARNSMYHATDLEGMRGILESGQIAPLGEELDWETASPAEIANEQAKVAEGNLGVSVSRTPRVLSKADKAITFVIDAEKMPATRPYVEEGYAKTIEEATPEKEQAYDAWQRAIGTPQEEQLKQAWLDVPQSTYIDRNPHFEFEQRTYNEPIPLSAVRGIVVDKSALERVPFTKSEHQTYGDWLVKGNEGLDEQIANVQQLADKAGIKIRFVESGRDLHSYRAGMATLPKEMRFSVPLYDQLQELPSGQVLNKLTGIFYQSVEDAVRGIDQASKVESPERVRGQADIPLSKVGEQQANLLAQRAAAKGGFDELIMGSSTRTRQMGAAMMTHNPLMNVKDITDSMMSQARGELEGAEHTGAVSTYEKLMAEKYPDTPISGNSQYTGKPGESFNQVKGRVLPYIAQVMKDWQDTPDKKVAVMTHFTPIRLVDAWRKAGFPGDLSIDMDAFQREHASPGSAYRLAPNAQGEWKLRKVNMENNQPLQPGIYLIRHAETEWNKGGIPDWMGKEQAGEDTQTAQGFQGKYKETPLTHRFVGDIPGEAKGFTVGAGVGEKPSVFFRDTSRDTMFHENLHAHFENLGVSDWLNSEHAKDGFVWDVYRNLFPPEAKELYAGHAIPEEVFAYTASAIRTGDEEMLDRIAEADTDRGTTLQWAAQTAQSIIGRAAEDDVSSLHFRTMQRRLDEVTRRASNHLNEIARADSPSPLGLDIDRNMYVVKDGDSRTYFDSRLAAVDHMEREFQEPLQSPDLVDTSMVPKGTPKYALEVPAPSGRPPVTSDPLPPELTEKPAKSAGALALSRFFRPFYDWLSDVAERYDRKDLYSAFSQIEDSRLKYENALRPHLDTLLDTIGSMGHERQTDLFKWLQADEEHRPFIEQELNMKPEEIDKMAGYMTDFLGKMEPDLLDYIKKDVPAIEAAGWKTDSMFPRGKTTSLIGKLVNGGQLDPKDTNLTRISSTYLRARLRSDIMEPALKSAEDLVKDSDDLGMLKPLLMRHIQAIRGIPDYTQKIAEGVISWAQEKINAGIASVNQHLPESLQIEPLSAPPREVLQDYLTFSYAGMLGARPGIWVRDASQFFVTSFPVLGNYTWDGMKKAFEVTKGGVETNAFKEAQRYGALIEKNQMAQFLQASGGESAERGALGKLEKASQFALSAQRWAHNSNRLTAFWGHQAKVFDALEGYGRDSDKTAFVKQSDAWFMNKNMRDKYLKELDHAGPDSYDDLSKRMAKDLVDITQWNYNRTASPGLYDYQLGRLFGQYGTWPLNYIEYARRFYKGSDKSAAMQALTRLVIAHGAILAGGQAAGIDTSDWVFTQPAAYGGGPLLSAVTSLPEAAGDWQSERGAEARRDVMDVVSPLSYIPGAEEGSALWEAVTTHDPNFWVRALGFHPLREADKQRGWHSIVP